MALDKMKKTVIIIRDEKTEYQMQMPKGYSGKVVLSFQKGILQGGKREDPFVPREIIVL